MSSESTFQAPPTAPPPTRQSEIQQKLKALQIIQQMIATQEKVLRDQQQQQQEGDLGFSASPTNSSPPDSTAPHVDIDLDLDAHDPSYMQASFSLLLPEARESEEVGHSDLRSQPPTIHPLPSDESLTGQGSAWQQADASVSARSPTDQVDTRKHSHSPSSDETGSQVSLLDVLPLLPSNAGDSSDGRTLSFKAAKEHPFLAQKESHDTEGDPTRCFPQDLSYPGVLLSMEQRGGTTASTSLEQRRRDQLRLLNEKIALARRDSREIQATRSEGFLQGDPVDGAIPPSLSGSLSAAQASSSTAATSTSGAAASASLSKGNPLDLSHNIPYGEYRLPGVPFHVEYSVTEGSAAQKYLDMRGTSQAAVGILPVSGDDALVFGDDPSILVVGPSVLGDMSSSQFGHNMESRTSTQDDVSGNSYTTIDTCSHNLGRVCMCVCVRACVCVCVCVCVRACVCVED